MRPKGVTVVAALTLLSAFALAFLFFVFWAVSVVGMGHGLPLTFSSLPFYLPLSFAFFGFAFAAAILRGATSKFLWYSSLLYWIALFLYFVWAYTYMAVWHYMFYLEGGEDWFSWYNILSYSRILFLPSPFIYAIGCLTYFLTKTPRKYFNIS
ncbi:MAG: hypothetical protein QXZ25_05395 [Candidatus Bathyarchaeia archaeon]